MTTKMVPGIYELVDGTVTVNQLRAVQIEDLLRREPVQTDVAAVQALITRAAGADYGRGWFDWQCIVPSGVTLPSPAI